ncbi:MAG: hypothetical protein KAH23_03880 [Kiritimatiellae bacterium]|nr:hypothetical protein [Kiritimatiellia bacterium]
MAQKSEKSVRIMNPHVFRTNSVRGIYGEDLTEDLFLRIGKALATNMDKVVVAADHRVSSPSLKNALIKGLLLAGCDVSDAGTAPKGMAIFAAGQLNRTLAYVSASHLPAEWNGLKFIHPDGRTFDRTENLKIKQAFDSNPSNAENEGRLNSRAWQDEYQEYLLGVLKPAETPLKLLVDSGNGTSALLAPALLEKLGFNVTSIFSDLDGRMPNRTSELTSESLKKAGTAMSGHDLGLAFDGDADRVAFIHPSGAIIDPECFAFVILRKLLETDPGPIVANVACGRTIADIAARFGRKLYRTPVGTPNVIGEVIRQKAAFGMETSSHLVIPSIVPYDDACAVGAYAAWALSCARAEGLSLDDLLDEVPPRPRRQTPVGVPDEIKKVVMEQLSQTFKAEFSEIEEIDGLRVTTDSGWALIRSSNTEPAIKLVVEANSDADLAKLTEQFTSLIKDAVTANTPGK